MNLMKIGKIVNTFGIKGELKVLSDSEFVDERFKVGTTIYLEDGTPLEISGYRMHKDNIMIKVNGSNDINEVEKYKTLDVYVDQDKIKPLEEGYYLFQLEDLDVYADNELIGKVIEVLKPSQTLLRIKLTDREMLVPFVDEFILGVDLDNNRVDINMMEGL